MTSEEYIYLKNKAQKGDKIAQAALGKYSNKSLNDAMSETFNLIGGGLKKGWNWLKDTGSRLFKGLTGETSAEATMKANQMNIENQNYWNQVAMEREDNAYQRQAADLQAAGLNPWLAAGGGGANAAALSTAQAEPEDGSKILQATSALALMAVVKLLGRTTSRTSTIIKK